MILFFAIVLFVGNIGVPIYTHACKEDGVFHSFFIEVNDHCEEVKNDLPPCCKANQLKEDDCCKDESTIIQLKLDYSTTWNDFQVSEFYFQPLKIKAVYTDNVALSTAYLTTNKGKDPPPKSYGKTLLIEHQTFRI